AAGISAAAARAGVPLTVNRVSSMLTPFFSATPVHDYDSAKHADTAMFARWFRRLLDAGVYLPPSQFEAAFVSTAHDDEALTFLESALRD
ncbi:MAG TPA: aspartate aminotransferase family protein, partial [Candidatus Dormibacteraeota bacterium]